MINYIIDVNEPQAATLFEKKLLYWGNKKMNNVRLAGSFDRMGEHKKAERLRKCAEFLEFSVDPVTDLRRLEKASFCKNILCPVCQKKKSRRMVTWLSIVMDKIDLDYPDLVPVFLTLTLRNCSSEGLKEALNAIFDGWYSLLRYRHIARIVQGWFRSVEITYSARTDTFHPHLHSVLLVHRNYFKSDDYMTTQEWSLRWSTAANLGYQALAYIQKVKNIHGNRKGIKEVAKYSVKESDFLFSSESLMDHVVQALAPAMKGRRFFAFGGLMARVKRELGLKLGNKNWKEKRENTIRGDVAELIERYDWNFELCKYMKC